MSNIKKGAKLKAAHFGGECFIKGVRENHPEGKICQVHCPSTQKSGRMLVREDDVVPMKKKAPSKRKTTKAKKKATAKA